MVNFNANTASGYSIDRKDRGSSAYPRLSIPNGGQSPVGSYHATLASKIGKVAATSGDLRQDYEGASFAADATYTYEEHLLCIGIIANQSEALCANRYTVPVQRW